MAFPSIQIFVIDDNPMNLTLLSKLISKMGHDVHTYDQGEMALEEMGRHHPDLILLDINMPGMDGFEVCSHIKRREALRETPVIFISALHDVREKVRAFECGGVDYITKPFNAEEFMIRVNTHLKLRQASQNLEAQNATLQNALAELKLVKNIVSDYASKLEQELQKRDSDEEAGKRLQFRMLPADGVKMGPFEFHRELKPSFYLSGDFVDYFRIDEKNLGFFMADVSGHGVASALVTAMIKSFFINALENDRRGVDPAIRQPARMLSSLNQELLHENLEKHAAIFYGIINESTDDLTFSNGGQFPFPVLCHGDGITILEEKSLPVGLFENVTFQTRRLKLPDTFALMIFSDGILDVLPEPDLDARLKRLNEMTCQSQGTIPQIFKEIPDKRLNAPPDDIAVLSITRSLS